MYQTYFLSFCIFLLFFLYYVIWCVFDFLLYKLFFVVIWMWIKFAQYGPKEKKKKMFTNNMVSGLYAELDVPPSVLWFVTEPNWQIHSTDFSCKLGAHVRSHKQHRLLNMGSYWMDALTACRLFI